MSRDGVYNRNYTPEMDIDPYQMNHGQGVRGEDLISGRPTEGKEGSGLSDSRYKPNETSRGVHPAGDPHGYRIGQSNFADLKRQLHEIEAEEHIKQQSPRPMMAEQPLKATPPHIASGQIYSSPERPLNERESYESDFSSEEFSSTDDSSKDTNRSSKSKSRSSTTSSLQKGYREVRHFAGGMIHHPSESTEHYSILRHSHGLVFYQGTSTSIAISIFADTDLPPNRTIWLKPKKWSETSKNRATFRHQTHTMVNVTPATPVMSDQINPSDERAWQRDILEFERRTHRGPRSKHALEETSVVRIPASAGDGYFQLVLCIGDREEILCTSPAFRLLSVSPNMGAISGAHWTTLPLEVGAIALSIQARRYVGAALLPAKLAVKGKADPYMPVNAGKAKVAGKLAYGATGASDRIGAELAAFNRKYNEERDGTFTPVWKIDDDYESGPKHPYPIRFTARCEVSKSEERHIMPMTKLMNVPDIATYKLCGHYFGWCYSPELTKKDSHIHKRHHWYQAVIVVSPIDIDNLDRVTMSRANRKDVQIQILVDSQEQPLNNSEMKVEVYGCLRPWDQELETMLAKDLEAGEEVAYETAFINEMSDITLTQTILDEPAWGPEAVSQQEEEATPKTKAHGMERIKQEYTQKRLAVQKKIDQVPLHKMGVRMPVDKRKDKSVVMNGYYIKR